MVPSGFDNSNELDHNNDSMNARIQIGVTELQNDDIYNLIRYCHIAYVHHS